MKEEPRSLSQCEDGASTRRAYPAVQELEVKRNEQLHIKMERGTFCGLAKKEKWMSRIYSLKKMTCNIKNGIKGTKSCSPFLFQGLTRKLFHIHPQSKPGLYLWISAATESEPACLLVESRSLESDVQRKTKAMRTRQERKTEEGNLKAEAHKISVFRFAAHS